MAKNENTMIAISKIHDLPGVNYERQNDKAYSGLVSSIITQGIQEPLIVRQREDGEYQLVSGYRRRRAGELAKLSELPAVVYDMSEKEALEYYKASRDKADIPIPGKKVENEKPKEKRKKTEKTQKPKEEELAAPAGTSISKVLESRLAKPDEKALEELPKPVEHETYFVIRNPLMRLQSRKLLPKRRQYIPSRSCPMYIIRWPSRKTTASMLLRTVSLSSMKTKLRHSMPWRRKRLLDRRTQPQPMSRRTTGRMPMRQRLSLRGTGFADTSPMCP